MIAHRSSLSILLAMGLAGATAAQTPHLIRTIEGETLKAEVVSIADDQIRLRIEDREEVRAIDTLQLVSLGADRTYEPLIPTLWLRSGQALPATFRGSSESGARFSLPGVPGHIELPWRMIRAVCFDPEAPRDPGFVQAVDEGGNESDLLYARRGDGRIVRASVEFLGFEGDQLQVRLGATERAMPANRVYGVVLGKFSGAAADALPNPVVTAQFRGGLRLTGKLVSMDAVTCRIRLAEGVEVATKRSGLMGFAVASDRLVFLSDLEPEIQQTAAHDTVWPPLRDCGPGGGAISMNGRDHARGFVASPRTRMTFAIDGRFDLLETEIGFESRAAKLASAVFRVLGDDRVLFDSGAVNPGMGTQSLSLDVTDVRRLTLEVDFGEGLDLGDLCVFATPMLIVK